MFFEMKTNSILPEKQNGVVYLKRNKLPELSEILVKA
jgi:hypothetical protein